MWTRKELKAKAKSSFKMNYWKTVLVALLVLALGGGASATSSVSGASGAAAAGVSSNTAEYQEDGYADASTFEEFTSLDDGATDINTMPYTVTQEIENADGTVTTTLDSGSLSPALGMGIIMAIFILVAVVGALALSIRAFIVNPISVGTSRFFLRNLNSQAEVKEIAYAFDNNYRENVKAMFWRDIYTFLWSLLFVIPGIIKAYEYRLIPYLLADDPTMTKQQAFAQSKELMRGNKWRAFVLDLSFLGWVILSIFTLGILYIFYVNPYSSMTDAALYEKLRYGNGLPAGGASGPKHAAGKHAAQVPIAPLAAEE